MQRLAEGLGSGALPALEHLEICDMPVYNAGTSALAAALGRGALPQLTSLTLFGAAIGNAELKALAPALRQLPALGSLDLMNNPLGDEGLAALVAPPPPPAGAVSPPTGGLTKLGFLNLNQTQISDSGCVTLAFALDNGALPALFWLELRRIPASTAAKVAVQKAMQEHMAYYNMDARRPFGCSIE